MRIEIEDLKKSYDGDVLSGITLNDDVKTLAVIGRSGCGKSTLLRIMGGLVEKTSGRVCLDGLEVADTSAYRRNIGFVFQQSGLFSHLCAMDNITLPLIKVHGMSKQQATERAGELLERFGLCAEAAKRPAELSGGQKQRIAIARAVAPKPRILLLDEPTSALDPSYTTEVLEVINELRGEDLSFVIATHEMGFALHSCEKVAFMDGGVIVEYGDSKKMFSDPQTSELKQFLARLLQWRV